MLDARGSSQQLRMKRALSLQRSGVGVEGQGHRLMAYGVLQQNASIAGCCARGRRGRSGDCLSFHSGKGGGGFPPGFPPYHCLFAPCQLKTWFCWAPFLFSPLRLRHVQRLPCVYGVARLHVSALFGCVFPLPFQPPPHTKTSKIKNVFNTMIYFQVMDSVTRS